MTMDTASSVLIAENRRSGVELLHKAEQDPESLATLKKIKVNSIDPINDSIDALKQIQDELKKLLDHVDSEARVDNALANKISTVNEQFDEMNKLGSEKNQDSALQAMYNLLNDLYDFLKQNKKAFKGALRFIGKQLKEEHMLEQKITNLIYKLSVHSDIHASMDDFLAGLRRLLNTLSSFDQYVAAEGHADSDINQIITKVMGQFNNLRDQIKKVQAHKDSFENFKQNIISDANTRKSLTEALSSSISYLQNIREAINVLEPTVRELHELGSTIQQDLRNQPRL